MMTFLRIVQLIGLVMFIITGGMYVSLYGLSEATPKTQGMATIVGLSFITFLGARVMRWVKADLK